MNKFVNYTLIAAALFCVVTIAIIGALAVMYYMTPPPVEYVEVQAPAPPPVIQTVIVEVERVVEVPITATPAPEQIAAEPYPAPVQPTPIPPTPTEPPVDYALLASVDMPSEILAGYRYQANITVANAGNVPWQYYGVRVWYTYPNKQPVEWALILIDELLPGDERELVFDLAADTSTHGRQGEYRFEVLNTQAEIVPWLPVGGAGGPNTVYGVQTIGILPPLPLEINIDDYAYPPGMANWAKRRSLICPGGA